jgi:hypothetical protein
MRGQIPEDRFRNNEQEITGNTGPGKKPSVRSVSFCKTRIRAHQCSSWQKILRLSQQQFPIADVDPFLEFPADFLEVADLLETEFLVQGNAGHVGQGHAADDAMEV